MENSSGGNSDRSTSHQSTASQLNGSGLRRPQTLLSPTDQQKMVLQPMTLTLTIKKDANGYGMKVSGDNPVFVDSVKPGGAAEIAGLVAGDMILKVNGDPVRYSTHPKVVALIKAATNVELTVQRNIKMSRPTSIMGPSTPLVQRSSITAPVPVDNTKKRELEVSKIHTLNLMRDQERKNLESISKNSAERKRAEANIAKLDEQIKQVCGEDPAFLLLNSPSTILASSFHQAQAPTSTTPAFLSRFPRSLSSLSLGTKKKADKDLPTSISANLDTSLQSETNTITPTKNKRQNFNSDKKGDVPPPLPQRNILRKSLNQSIDDTEIADVKVFKRNTPISDLDQSVISEGSKSNSNMTIHTGLSSSPLLTSSSVTKSKKRTKNKTKALSDPKMNSQTFLQIESRRDFFSEPPPLPPRQIGLNDPINLKSQLSSPVTDTNNRPLPNSINTLMNYPLVATVTATVRDNISAAYPLSQRPNIVQQLQHQQQQQQQHQQQQNLQQYNFHSNSKSPGFGFSQSIIQSPVQKHRRVISSPEKMHKKDLSSPQDRKSSSGTWDMVDRKKEITPPGTPPPPYLQSSTCSVDSRLLELTDVETPNLSIAMQVNTPSATISAAQTNLVQKSIISMEDDEISDQEGFIDEHGPFRSFSKLLEPEHTAHLSVFLNFVLSNSDPAPVLFYLITSLYKEGTVKDMRKWAYEIHSTFLVPSAPLLWSNVDESLAREIDIVLQNEFDKGEILRKIFWKSRGKAKDIINTQLQEYQIKRTAGLGTMYGPSDQVLLESKGDKNREQKIVEETLIPKLQQYLDEIDKEVPNECPKKSALCSALSTVLHRIFVARSNPGSPIDRVHHFVSREKSFKNRIMGKNRKALVRGHHLVLRQYYEVTHCNHCQNIIWGVSPQGYHCTDCELNIHRACSKILEENCPGPVPQKRKEQHTDNKISKLMEKIMPTHHFIQMERLKRQEEDGEDIFPGEKLTPSAIIRQPSDRRPDSNNGSFSANSSGASDVLAAGIIEAEGLNRAEENDIIKADSSKSKSAPVSVNRSESYKERSQKRNRNNRRKTSDPSLSKTTDEQNDLEYRHFSGSSTSSLSSSSDSPSTSMEQVGVIAPQPTTLFPTQPTARQWIDSDEECNGELVETDWTSNVSSDILQTLSDAEKKRQEVINEIYQTERNHVRTLRLLEGIFMRPLQESGVLSGDHLQLLFPPSLQTLKDLHTAFENNLKQRRLNQPLVGDIGDLLLAMFDGRSGEELKEHAAQFCARQQIALEALKEKRRKDEHLQRLLSKAESHKACRRLQLKDLLPTALQRLTKYPLLFESLYKITNRVAPDNTVEEQAILKALESSKKILNHVNQAVRVAEDAHKLQTIQKKLDKSEKDAPIEFKNIDLTAHKLIHDGLLIMKKSPGVQLHGLLFENMMVLLQRQDDKYLLKFPPTNVSSNEMKNQEGRFNPITKINLILVRQSAVDKNTFFLINTNVSQMLELTAPSSSECKTWFKHISSAAEAYKSRHKASNDETTSTNNIVTNISATGQNTFENITETPTLNDEKVKHDISPILVQKPNAEDTPISVSEVSDEKECAENDEKDEIDENNLADLDETNSNDTRTVTQQMDLVAPNEIHVTAKPLFSLAEPVLTRSEQLKRLDSIIRAKLAEKQKIVCDILRIPSEHFLEISDMVGQPEAPNQEPTDLILAAFAKIQSLTELLSDHVQAFTSPEISAASMLCDDCNKNLDHTVRNKDPDVTIKSGNNYFATLNAELKRTPSSASMMSNASHTSVLSFEQTQSNLNKSTVITEDENGYCQIDELRLPAINNISPIVPVSPQPVLSKHHQITMNVLDAENVEKNFDEIDDVKDNKSKPKESEALLEEIKRESLESKKVNISCENRNEQLPAEGSCGINRLASRKNCPPTIPCHVIMPYIDSISSHISQLLPKIKEREVEREQLRKERQHYQDLWISLNEQTNRVATKETLSEDITQDGNVT